MRYQGSLSNKQYSVVSPAVDEKFAVKVFSDVIVSHTHMHTHICAVCHPQTHRIFSLSNCKKVQITINEVYTFLEQNKALKTHIYTSNNPNPLPKIINVYTLITLIHSHQISTSQTHPLAITPSYTEITLPA